MLNLDPFRPSIDEEDWSPDRDKRWEEIEDEATSAGISRGEWEYTIDVEEYGDYEYDEDGVEK
ncbi:hypothetical protein V8V73_18940 [Priestia megaterium]|uniref:hypothetical protein n=1 Tax=Priestia megaterium TaxID=1404 RepID=UPI003009B643